jgi:thiol:disulfide interchange protein DsbD
VQVALVFLVGLGLAFTPCVYPMIPITISFFSEQAKGRTGGTFPLAVVYVLGIAVTYSTLGVIAALTGRLFGSALQSPWVVGFIVVILLALAASMFGLWELRVPSWAMNLAGGRQGILGSLVMGLVVGIVAAPCVGPAVVGLLTYVGTTGDPVLGFVLFFSLALGLGFPYLLLGTFTGMLQKMPMSGPWMIGVRKVFGVLLVALAAYFARPLLPGSLGDWLIAGSLVIGALYLLVYDRTGHEQAGVDRVMRLACAVMLGVGVLQMPLGAHQATVGAEVAWQSYDASAERAIESGELVILDFYADWCAPCRELDEKTFSDPRVAAELEPYARFKVDQTRPDDTAQELAEQYRVVGVPTVIVYRDGQEAFRITGFEPPDRFLERLHAVGG